jgi:hypothetical protein
MDEETEATMLLPLFKTAQKYIPMSCASARAIEHYVYSKAVEISVLF